MKSIYTAGGNADGTEAEELAGACTVGSQKQVLKESSERKDGQSFPGNAGEKRVPQNQHTEAAATSQHLKAGL